MVAKEWRDARWEVIVGAGLVLVVGVMIPFDTLLPNPYSLFGEPENVIAPSPREDAQYLAFLLWSQWFSEASGNPFLMLMAAILGAGLISGETSRGTIRYHLLPSQHAGQPGAHAADQVCVRRRRAVRGRDGRQCRPARRQRGGRIPAEDGRCARLGRVGVAGVAIRSGNVTHAFGGAR